MSSSTRSAVTHSTKRCARSTGRLGCWSSAFAAGRIQAVPANLILVKNIAVIGVVWGAQSERDPVLISRNLAELLRWWEAGRLKPLVAKVFRLAEAGTALATLLSRRHAGKIVLQT
jgi:NADPH:quinone reductase